MAPRATLNVRATAPDGSVKAFAVRSRIDTPAELTYYQHGGILHFVLRSLVTA
jgi:aconitate hydratase